MRKRFFLLLVILCCCTGPGRGENSAVLTERESIWEAGGSVVYSGRISLEKECPGAVWLVDLKTDDTENPGEAVFTRINDESIRIRKRSNTMTEDALTGENTFEITWFLPGQITRLSRGEISFRLESPEGKVLCTANTLTATGSSNSGDRGLLLLSGVNQIIRILIFAACAIWILGGIRIFFLYRKRKKTQAE